MGLWSETHSYECNRWAIGISLHRRDLEVAPILKFEEFLFGEEIAVDKQVAVLERASAPAFVVVPLGERLAAAGVYWFCSRRK